MGINWMGTPLASVGRFVGTSTNPSTTRLVADGRLVAPTDYRRSRIYGRFRRPVVSRVHTRDHVQYSHNGFSGITRGEQCSFRSSLVGGESRHHRLVVDGPPGPGCRPAANKAP